MALPRKMSALQKVLGASDLTLNTIELQPSTSSASTSYEEFDTILFNIPSYPKHMIDMSKSFLRFDLKVECAGGQKARVHDNLPIFQQLTCKTGGRLIEQIVDYQHLDRIFTYLEDINGKQTSGLYGNYFLGGSTIQPTNDTIADLQMAGRTYCKKFYSGLLNPMSDYYFPICLLNPADSGLQVEFLLSRKQDVLEKVTPTDTSFNDAEAKYIISNVKMQLAMVKLSDSVFNSYMSAVNSNKLTLPFTTFKRHATSLAGSDVVNCYIHENAKNLKRTFSVIKPHVSTIPSNNPPFRGGMKDGTFKVMRYGFSYSSKRYPAVNVEMTTDNQIALANLLAATNGLFKHTPLIAAVDGTGASAIEGEFMLVNDFQYCSDELINCGLNTASSTMPINIELNFDTTVNGFTLYTYVEQSQEMYIDGSGHMSLAKSG
jgi:hypothetical protein